MTMATTRWASAACAGSSARASTRPSLIRHPSAFASSFIAGAGGDMKQTLLRVLAILAAGGLATGAGAASPDSAFPQGKPIRIIVPFTAGSATDIMARIIGPRMVERWGRQVVTDNRPSAGGIVACQIVAEATPDGHTLMVTGSNFAGSAALYSKLPFDPVRDFSGITQIASTPLVLVVNAGTGVKSVKELIALLREKPGQLNYASTGLGSGPHYGAELFLLQSGVKPAHVPYRRSPQTRNGSIGWPWAF